MSRKDEEIMRLHQQIAQLQQVIRKDPELDRLLPVFQLVRVMYPGEDIVIMHRVTFDKIVAQRAAEKAEADKAEKADNSIFGLGEQIHEHQISAAGKARYDRKARAEAAHNAALGYGVGSSVEEQWRGMATESEQDPARSNGIADEQGLTDEDKQ